MAEDSKYDLVGSVKPSFDQIIEFTADEYINGRNKKGSPIKTVIENLVFDRYNKSTDFGRGTREYKTKSSEYDKEGYKIPEKIQSFCREELDKGYIKEILNDKTEYTHFYVLLDKKKVIAKGGRKINKRKGTKKQSSKGRIKKETKKQSRRRIKTMKGGGKGDINERINDIKRGYIRGFMITTEDKRTIYINIICVAPRHSYELRTKKIFGSGGLLLKYIINKMNKDSYKKYIYLNAIQSAVGFYINNGFILVPYGEDIDSIDKEDYESYKVEQTYADIGEVLSEVQEEYQLHDNKIINERLGYNFKCGDEEEETDEYYTACIEYGFEMVRYKD